MRYTLFTASYVLTKDPTHPDTVADFTDWQKVETFGRRISGM